MKKILFFDLESSPLLVHTWGMYEQNALDIVEESHLLTVAYKWLGDKEVKSLSLPEFKGYKRDKKSDEKLVEAVWKLFEEADMIVAHHGKAFDIKYMNARFIKHHIEPNKKYHILDTKQIAKKVGLFPSNKLDYLGEYLGEGRKMHTGGYELWDSCMKGDLKAFKKMAEYNRQDVALLERIYLRFRPWVDTHPHVAPEKGIKACPNCGGTHVHKRGFERLVNGLKQRYQCQNCGKKFQGGLNKTLVE